ncbi:D(2) dopamine receptor A-like [Dendronephthya gigantea]|uniref:D(2) dopamine receptor A-like n=1 Tax=Dendronephthya gigantea TaxID=151771 RepID=UPI00106B1BA4|nr:D(2) dopamine receptor A-like [Dendronephthya gigantea]
MGIIAVIVIVFITFFRVNIKRVTIGSVVSSVALSVGNLLAITIDRFIFISRPLKYPVIMTWERTYFMLIVVWVLCFLDAGILCFQTREENDLIYCRTNSQLILSIDMVSFYIPVMILIYLNYKIFKVARRQGRKVRNQPVRLSSTHSNSFSGSSFTQTTMRQLKLIKTFLVLLGIFLLCFIPYAVVKTMDMFHCTSGHCVPTRVYVFSVLLVGVNSVCNPFIYGIRLKEYRNAFRSAVSKMYSACACT